MNKHYLVVIQLVKTEFLRIVRQNYTGFTLAGSEQQAVDNALNQISQMRQYIGFNIVSANAEVVPVQICPYNAEQTAVHLTWHQASQGIFIRMDLPNPAPYNFKIEFEHLLSRYFSAIGGIRWS